MQTITGADALDALRRVANGEDPETVWNDYRHTEIVVNLDPVDVDGRTTDLETRVGRIEDVIYGRVAIAVPCPLQHRQQ